MTTASTGLRRTSDLQTSRRTDHFLRAPHGHWPISGDGPDIKDLLVAIWLNWADSGVINEGPKYEEDEVNGPIYEEDEENNIMSNISRPLEAVHKSAHNANKSAV